jgi:hypothetical protein
MVRLIDNPDIGELGMLDVPTAPAVPGIPKNDLLSPFHHPPLL